MVLEQDGDRPIEMGDRPVRERRRFGERRGNLSAGAMRPMLKDDDEDSR
jgi:hypothetical protein